MVEKGHSVAFFVPRGRFDTPFRVKGEVHEVRLFYYIRTMRDWAPDAILYNFFLTSYLYPLFRDVKGIYFVQDFESYFFSPLHPFHHMARMSYRFPMEKVATSRWLASMVGANAFVYPGVDLEVFSFEPERPWRRRILMFPRRQRHKGLDRILRIAPILKERGYELLFITRDEWLSRRLSGFGRVVSPSSDEELVSAYHSANVLLYTSKVEAFGLPIFEAMATGTPFITTRYPVLDELLPDSLGDVVLPEFDEGRILELLSRLEDEDYRGHLVSEGRRLVESRYSLSRFLREFYDVFLSLTG